MHEGWEERAFEGTPATAADRRRDERRLLPAGRRCQLVAWPDCRPRGAVLYDISAVGVGVILDEPLEGGREVVIRLHATATAAGHTLVGRVAYVMPIADDRWRIGCAFYRPVSEGELSALLPPG